MNAFKTLVVAAVLAASGVSAVPVAAQDEVQTGPSFDCRKARTFVEKAICRSRTLSAKDRTMDGLYHNFIAEYREGGGEGTDISPIVEEQRRWLARRDRCRTSACLHAFYDKRIKDLIIDY